MKRISVDPSRISDFGAALSRSAWHTRVACVMGCAFSLFAPDASACGATPHEAYPLLPAMGQEEVPLNAVLTIGLSVSTTATFELVRAESNEAVPLSAPHCEDTLCTAVPVSKLEPLTTYRYRAAIAHYPMTDWIKFTTGTNTDDTAPRADEVLVTLTSSETVDERNCGYAVSATLDIDATLLEARPVVVVAPGAMPSFSKPGIVMLTSGQTSVELRRVSQCFTPTLLDTAGHKTELSEICLSSAPSCSLARGPSRGAGPSLFAFAIVALLGLGRRLRSPG